MSSTLDILKKLKGNILVTLLMAIFAASFFGYTTGVIEAIWISYVEDLGSWVDEISKKSSFTSSAILGAFFGGSLYGFPADWYGRRNTLIIAVVNSLAGNTICMFGKFNFWIIVSGRFILGIGLGGISGITPLYFSESVPDDHRNFFGVIYQLAITLSILLASCFKFFSEYPTAWYYMTAFNFVPLIGLAVTLIFLKPSPRFLVGKDDKKAKTLFMKIFKTEEEVDEEMKKIAKSKSEKFSWALHFTYAEKMAFALCTVYAFGQQLTGINAIIYYFNSIYESFVKNKTYLNLLGVAVMFWNALTSFFSIFILSRFGRRNLTLATLACIIVSLFFVGTSFYLSNPTSVIFATFFTFFFILGFEWGVGPIYAMLITEFFTEILRGRIGSFMSGLQWLLNFFLTLVFPLLKDRIGFMVFYVFCGVAIIIQPIFIFLLPETKDLKITEIQVFA